MYDRSLLIFKNDILTNMYIQIHRKSSRRITIKLSTVVICRIDRQWRCGRLKRDVFTVRACTLLDSFYSVPVYAYEKTEKTNL